MEQDAKVMGPEDLDLDRWECEGGYIERSLDEEWTKPMVLDSVDTLSPVPLVVLA